MASRNKDFEWVSRRTLLKSLGLAPILLRPSPLSGYSMLFGSPEAPAPGTSTFPLGDFRLSPRYPARSPLQDVLRLVPPGSDEYASEKHAFEIAAILEEWSRCFRAGDLGGMTRWAVPALEAPRFVPAGET